ncbi:MAG TPA: IS200/IS605 family transposase [Candidatus Marinimicrobia bacterium]|nr:MAG: IS200/IS605 family transposase [Candidatus Marinimicrobia bacterium CG1_02_48_14]PIZ67446.1 MAG: IS200/IS605 family transposase [Candidatus Marinimicrobia bacterium CG_4_10_14_0_2_um_filter_48_9]HCW76915.1 IS200/IS605 family transposase [Candidatus Neomarinimicrobiota bacterium]
MSEHVHRRHNKTLLLYHLVFPVKYRRKVISGPVSETIRETCLEISDRYEINFIEIGTDEDHVHFLVQSVPVFSVEKIVRTIKSILGRLILSRHAEIKQELWGGNFWTSGYYANTVGQYGNEEVIKRYVESQGKKYVKIYDEQLHLF